MARSRILATTRRAGSVRRARAAAPSRSPTYAYDGRSRDRTATDSIRALRSIWSRYNDTPTCLPRIEDPLGAITTNLYDPSGNLISSTDAAGDTYQYTYDSSGNLTSTVNPLGQTVQIDHTVRSANPTSITDADGNTTQYKLRSRPVTLLSIAYPDGRIAVVQFDDPLGNMKETQSSRTATRELSIQRAGGLTTPKRHSLTARSRNLYLRCPRHTHADDGITVMPPARSRARPR